MGCFLTFLNVYGEQDGHNELQGFSDRTGKQILRIPATVCDLQWNQYPSAFCDGLASCMFHTGKIAGICPTKIGFCCVVSSNCGAILPTKIGYFQNNWFPKETAATGTCEAELVSYHHEVTQMRLDFLTFTLSQPNSAGECEEEYLTIEGADPNQAIPSLCGNLTGEHIHVNLDPEGDGTLSLIVTLVGTSDDISRWNILVTQYKQTDPLRASEGCLQYYTSSTGVVSSFNAGRQHLASQSYEACVSNPSSCSVSWTSTVFDVSPNVNSSDECLKNANDHVVIGGRTYCGTSAVRTSTDDYKLRVAFNGNEDAEGASSSGRRGFSFNYERTCT